MTDRRALATRIWLAISHELGLTLTNQATLNAVIAAAENELPATLAEQEVVPHSEGSTPTNRPNNTQPPPLGEGERMEEGVP